MCASSAKFTFAFVSLFLRWAMCSGSYYTKNVLKEMKTFYVDLRKVSEGISIINLNIFNKKQTYKKLNYYLPDYMRQFDGKWILNSHTDKYIEYWWILETSIFIISKDNQWIQNLFNIELQMHSISINVYRLTIFKYLKYLITTEWLKSPYAIINSDG